MIPTFGEVQTRGSEVLGLSDQRPQLCETWCLKKTLPQEERRGALQGPHLFSSLKGEWQAQESIGVRFDHREQTEGGMFVYEWISLQGINIVAASGCGNWRDR